MRQTQDLVKRLTVVAHTGFEKVQQNISQLAQAQAKTDSRLNILIDVVERYFSNGKEGK